MKDNEDYKKWLLELFKKYDDHRDGPHLNEGEDFKINTKSDTTC